MMVMDAKEQTCPDTKLDRFIFNADAQQDGRISTIEGYEVAADFRPRHQGTASYARVRRFRSSENASEIRVQYKPLRPWCRSLRVTSIADDNTGITRTELDAVLKECLNHRSSTIELAFDFPDGSGIDHSFVRQHARFGKSRRRHDRGGEGQLRYGDRRSPKMVRSYWKRNLKCYRIELELHSALLRRIGVTEISQFGRLYSVVPSHFSFVTISWKKLERHLRKKFGSDAHVLLEEARARAERSLRLALRFLRRSGISNPHRFLVPLRLNREIKMALRKWLAGFCRPEDQEPEHLYC
jgi:hypothetical protein